jgi:hypothetical protein
MTNDTTTTETWDSDEFRATFETIAFAAPFVLVQRRSDGVKGSVMFEHSPRIYHHFVPEEG